MTALGSTLPLGSGYAATGTSYLSSGESAYYNGFGLDNANYRLELDGDGDPEISYSEAERPRANGDIFISRFFRGRKFNVDFLIYSDECSGFTQLEFNAKKNILNAEDAYFVRKKGGEYQKIRCTCTGFAKNNKVDDKNSKSYTLTFDCTDEFWSAINDNSNTYSITTLPHVEEITHSGSADSSRPVIYLIMNTVTSLSTLSVNITDIDGDNNFTFTYPAALTVNDILKIDCQTYKAYKNGTQIFNFTGTFPVFATKPNTITFTGTGTIDCTATFIYPVNYH